MDITVFVDDENELELINLSEINGKLKNNNNNIKTDSAINN